MFNEFDEVVYGGLGDVDGVGEGFPGAPRACAYGSLCDRLGATNDPMHFSSNTSCGGRWTGNGTVRCCCGR